METTMKNPLMSFYAFLDRPLFTWSRVVIALLVIPLVFSFLAPLWRISMTAPQYPDVLYMDIYSYKLEGGNDGQHITEINTLNHYIGMHSIDRTALSDLDWIPFALGALLLFTLRVAAVGNVRSLIDLVIMTSYVSLFAFARFVYKLWVFGHDLAPDAPVKVAPFMPVVIGTKQVANFETQSTPLMGSLWLGIFVVGIVVIAIVHLVLGRIHALREQRKALAEAAK
jgi:hypothetical protein